MASELGITNGHAARRKYPRCKQKFEGIRPVRRNPNSKRASRNKRAKEKDTPVIKSKQSPALADQMEACSPSVASFDTSQESLQPMLETVVKSKPREDRLSPSSSPEIPVATLATSQTNQVQRHGGIYYNTSSYRHTLESLDNTFQLQNQF